MRTHGENDTLTVLPPHISESFKTLLDFENAYLDEEWDDHKKQLFVQKSVDS